MEFFKVSFLGRQMPKSITINFDRESSAMAFIFRLEEEGGYTFNAFDKNGRRIPLGKSSLDKKMGV